MPQPSITKIRLKITYLKFYWNSPGASELNIGACCKQYNVATTVHSRHNTAVMFYLPLKWRHNERGGVSNHLPYDCLLKPLFGRRSKKTSKLRVTGFCARNSPVTGEFPPPPPPKKKGPVTRKIFPFDDVIMSSWLCCMQRRIVKNRAIERQQCNTEINMRGRAISIAVWHSLVHIHQIIFAVTRTEQTGE